MGERWISSSSSHRKKRRKLEKRTPDGGVLGSPLAEGGQEPLDVVTLDQSGLGGPVSGLQVGHELSS
ncbi:MAG TPA: hypothetical protein VFD01_16100 [Candidatus Dormibacteraeota bacterium]|nr:hypothetical protein [Candidatus Dormibacteraeota bacterium]